jgi:hypothetical protein
MTPCILNNDAGVRCQHHALYTFLLKKDDWGFPRPILNAVEREQSHFLPGIEF